MRKSAPIYNSSQHSGRVLGGLFGVEVVIYRLGGRAGHARGLQQLLQFGGCNGFGCLKVAIQGGSPGFANAGDFGQGQFQSGFAVLGAGIGDGKAVDFVLDGRYQMKRPLVGGDGNLPAVTGNGPGAVPVILHHAVHRNIQPKGAYQRQDGVQVPLSTVQQD